MSRLSAALSVIGRIECQYHKTTLRKLVCIYAGTLLFNAAVWRTYNNCRILLSFIDIRTCIQVCRKFYTISVRICDLCSCYIIAEVENKISVLLIDESCGVSILAIRFIAFYIDSSRPASAYQVRCRGVAEDIEFPLSGPPIPLVFLDFSRFCL